MMLKWFIISICFISSLFATEVIWSDNGYIDSTTYDKAIKEYVDKTYPQKVKAYQKYLHRFDKPIDAGSYIFPAMVYIKKGFFMMGSNDGYEDEKPMHGVYIDYDFYIGKYEVTFAEYDKFCKDTGRKKSDDEGWGRGSRPVINVSWNDAKAYTEWLSKKTGKKFRLPSEAEWEYVARAGTRTKYSFGDYGGNLEYYAWYKGNSNGKTHKVGLKNPNPWGIYDILGNVCEWCGDWYVSSYDNTPRDGSANYSGSHKYKVLRGGSWKNRSKRLRSAFHDWNYPDVAYDDFGFRLLLEH